MLARHLRLAVALSAVVAAAASPAFAQGFPTRPITLIVPFAPGGSTDVIGRVVSEAMRPHLGQHIVVENRAGAGGSIGTAAIAKAAPDGYTIGMGTASTLAINPAAYRTLPFDVLTDLAPVGGIAAVPNIMTVNADLPVNTMAQFIAYAKSRPGKLSYGSSGNGSVSHLMGEQCKLASGTDLIHVPYRGIGPALNDAVAGQIQVLFDNLPTSLPLVQAGRLRALAVSGPKRVAALPDVPTFGELGFDDVNWMAFFGMVAPAGTPPAAIATLNDALNNALADPAVREKLTAQQAEVTGGPPEKFSAEYRKALEAMRRAVAAAKIEVN
ncbi:MAG: tripartite tricarboxylate transporter substrate binding protein [Pseudorhodoplanes sp.]|nr:tripartite tricarboxylate transporter substrate binding protein [Pseudorhodoplanes sp.]